MLGYGFYPDETNADTVALAIDTAQFAAPSIAPRASGQPAPEAQVFHLRSEPLTIPTELLSTTAQLVANAREAALLSISSPISPDQPPGTGPATGKHPPMPPSPPIIAPGLQRNRAAVAAQLLLTLRHKTAAITAHHPPAPRNPRQRDAQRYRDGQLRVLAQYARRLAGYLRALHAEGRTVGLPAMLDGGSPAGVARPFRAAVRAGWGTRDPDTLLSRGAEDAACALWVCTVWAVVPAAAGRGEGSGSSDESRVAEDGGADGRLLARLGRWKRFLERAYGAPPGWGRNGLAVANDNWQRKTLQSWYGEDDGPDELAAESYMGIVRAAVARHPESVYADARWTPGFLLWGLKVWREEAVLVPLDTVQEDEDGEEEAEGADGHQQEEEDRESEVEDTRCEHVLFLEGSESPDDSSVASEESSVLMMDL